MKQDTGPAVLILLVGIVSLALWQSTPVEPWSPPYLGRDLGWGKIELSGLRITLDTRGLEGLSEISFLPAPLPELKPDQMLEVASTGATPIKLAPDDDARTVYPRAMVSQRVDEQWIRATLYQPDSGKMLFAGPLEGHLDTSLYRPAGGGVPLDALALIPSGASRILLLDTAGLNLNEELRNQLVEQWKRWEFEPYIELAGAFTSPFLYAEWKERKLLVTGVKSWEPVERALQRRFPLNVVDIQSTWSHATTISGFEKDSGPAWMSRGNQLIATPDGGVQYLDELLLERYSRASSFRSPNPFLKELVELSESQKGWHVAIIEQPPGGGPQWGALVRWPRPDDPSIEGFLVVWVPPKSWKDRDS